MNSINLFIINHINIKNYLNEYTESFNSPSNVSSNESSNVSSNESSNESSEGIFISFTIISILIFYLYLSFIFFKKIS